MSERDIIVEIRRRHVRSPPCVPRLPWQSSSIDEYDEDEERVRVVEIRENREAQTRVFTSFSSYSDYSVDLVDNVHPTTDRRVYYGDFVR